MLPSLHIQGFRCFRELTIERLGRVNLIVGKNNVGKTTLLDALRVHAAWADALFELQAMLDRRGEILRARKPVNSSERHMEWRRVFHDALDGRPKALISGDFRDEGKARKLQLTFVPDGERHLPAGRKERAAAIFLALNGANSGRYWVDQPLERSSQQEVKSAPYQYIPSSGLLAGESSRLWDDIVLTPHEETCLQALRIIEPDILRVALVDVPGADSMVERAPHVLRRARSQPEPLRSLGEGMNRLFDITLGMVNAREGRLLIDEIENGLHYSILEELWRYVFQVASMLDVQVFATTHSWGCIEAFQAAARANPEEGILIRLERREGETRAFLFDENELAVVAEQAIEVR